MMKFKHTRDWLCLDRGLRTGNKVECIQVLSSTLPTMVNKTRGCTDMIEERCRKCRTGIYRAIAIKYKFTLDDNKKNIKCSIIFVVKLVFIHTENLHFSRNSQAI